MIVFENIIHFDSSISFLICVFLLIFEISLTAHKKPLVKTSFICFVNLFIGLTLIIGSSIISPEMIYANTFFTYVYTLIVGIICFLLLTDIDLQRALFNISCVMLCIIMIFRADTLVVWPLYNCMTGLKITEVSLQIPITSKISLSMTVCHLIRVIEVLFLLIILHHTQILRKYDLVPISKIWMYIVLLVLGSSVVFDKYLTRIILNATALRMVFLLQICTVFLIFTGIHFHKKAVIASVRAEHLKTLEGINTKQMQIMFEQFINASENHYIINHLRILQAYIESGNTKKAEDYLNDMMPSFFGPGLTGRYTENVFVNAVLNHIQTKWPDTHINIECTAADLSHLDSVEFGMLLVNIINYRIIQIEDSTDMSLNIRICQFQEMLIITIDGLVVDDRMKRNSLEFASIDNSLNRLYGFTDIGEDGNIRFFLPIIPFDSKN